MSGKSKKQAMFGDNGEVTTEVDGKSAQELKREAELQKELEALSRMRAVCPWCLYVGTFDKFAELNEKTMSLYKLYRCPDCGQRMKEKTLRYVDELGAEDWCEWFWDQIFSYKQYERVSWEKLKGRLPFFGMTQIFWAVWRERKGVE